MQFIRTWYGVRGSGRLADYALRWSRMLTDESKRRVRILAFWAKHGLEATVEAFSVSRSTLFSWQAQLKKGNGQLEALNPKPKAPKARRRRLWPLEVIAEIKRLRSADVHPNPGKENIHPELLLFCRARSLRCPSLATIGRLIADAPDKMRVFPQKVRHNGTVVPRKRQKKLRKPKGFVATAPAECVAFDTIERIKNGCRRYIITNIDLFDRVALAVGTVSHASAPPAAMLKATQACYPTGIGAALSDNGSEFQKHFAEAVQRAGMTHWHTYTRTPKMNAHCERFNRTIQEEFVDYHEDLLFTDLPAFNRLLADYLIWYNTVRRHRSLNNQAPLNYRLATRPESRMWWAHTRS